jgi:putative hemolysin
MQMKNVCKSQLTAAGLMDTVRTISSNCPRVPKGANKGCAKNIPSVGDHNAQQSCGSGSGFWAIGSVCPVTCAAGFTESSGHRRTQAGVGVDYVCTQGGDWMSSAPINCVTAGPAQVFSPTAGCVKTVKTNAIGRLIYHPRAPPNIRLVIFDRRYTASSQPMSISQATTYCRQQGGSLASIHSYEEQQQAVEVCMAMRTGTGADLSTASGDASNGGYGCWIGFQDIGDKGGFVWSDGSNVDFVDWAPSEPNGGFGQSAVAIDLRGHMGQSSTWSAGTRSGEWNDDSRDEGDLL